MTFQQIKELLSIERYKSVHKMIWDGFAIITDWDGHRYKLVDGIDIADVTGLLHAILTGSDNTIYYHKYRI